MRCDLKIYELCISIDLIYLLECGKALGMENNAISDGHISSSSTYSIKHLHIYGRLNRLETTYKAGGWRARTANINQWLQVDLGSLYRKVTRVGTQGRNGNYAMWVKKYKLLYSDDDKVTFQYHIEQGESTAKVKTYFTETLIDFSFPFLSFSFSFIFIF